jgi:hypothetical protein
VSEVFKTACLALGLESRHLKKQTQCSKIGYLSVCRVGEPIIPTLCCPPPAALHPTLLPKP